MIGHESLSLGNEHIKYAKVVGGHVICIHHLIKVNLINTRENYQFGRIFTFKALLK